MPKRKSSSLERIDLYSAGIDIGSKSHFVAVDKTLDKKPVREYSAFTTDLKDMSDWLLSLGVKRIAMESTGIYWIPVYQVLVSKGLEVKLVNARHLKNVPGRKTDVLDCQWIQRLHSYGLLAGAFLPDQITSELRAYLRQRENLKKMAGMHVQHMQKALHQMNLLLHNVVSDITGKTGMQIIKALIRGERDGRKLARYRDRRCHRTEKEIAKSLEGNIQTAHLFSLEQAVLLYEVYQSQIQVCDEKIEKHLASFQDRGDNNYEPKGRKRGRNKNDYAFDAGSALYRITGIDLTKIDGLEENTVLTILSECGSEMRPWKTEKHFTSWLGLCPGNKKSGGKNISGRTKRSASRAAAAFRLGANALHRSNSALGAYLRRMKARLGAPKAITATAHKLARIFYAMLKYKRDYVDLGQSYYEERYKERVIRNLQNRAKQFGFQLVTAQGSAST